MRESDESAVARSVYEASPACAERRCKIIRLYDLERLRYVYQHGDNPEAVLFVNRISCVVDPAAVARRRFREWAEEIHRYENGEPLATGDGEE